VATSLVGFGEAHPGLTAIIPRIRPVLVLKKQADQVIDLNVRLSYAGRQDLHRIVGMTYSAPARMPVGQRAVIVLRRV
jgi:hypothetical protein